MPTKLVLICFWYGQRMILLQDARHVLRKQQQQQQRPCHHMAMPCHMPGYARRACICGHSCAPMRRCTPTARVPAPSRQRGLARSTQNTYSQRQLCCATQTSTQQHPCAQQHHAATERAKHTHTSHHSGTHELARCACRLILVALSIQNGADEAKIVGSP